MILAIFDIDGTIVDSQDIIVEAQRCAFAAHGLAPPDRATSLSIVGLSLSEAFTVLVGEKGPVASLAAAYGAAFRELASDPRHHEPLYPDADAILRTLAARGDLVLGVATGKSRRGVERLVERHGWHDLFATVQTADDAPSKPDPAMIAQAMAATGAHARETVMIGDSRYDIAMARAAGIAAIGVSWGYHAPESLRREGARRIVTRFSAIPSAIDAVLAFPLAAAPCPEPADGHMG